MSGSWWPDNLFSTEGTVIHQALSFNELHLPTVIHGAFSFSELHLPIRKGYKYLNNYLNNTDDQNALGVTLHWNTPV